MGGCGRGMGAGGVGGARKGFSLEGQEGEGNECPGGQERGRKVNLGNKAGRKEGRKV